MKHVHVKITVCILSGILNRARGKPEGRGNRTNVLRSQDGVTVFFRVTFVVGFCFVVFVSFMHM